MPIKILIETRETQGARESDFNFCDSAEPVKFGFECDCDKNDIDGRCGCRRALVGIFTSRGTTTFTVAERPLTADDYVSLCLGAERVNGWIQKDSSEAEIKEYEEAAREALRVAEQFPVGAILEKRGDVIQQRVKTEEIK